MRALCVAGIVAGVLLCGPNAQAEPLLTTEWGQRDAYATYSPDHQRLGCWSTALAQILYFHRLAPFGAVSYPCSTGCSISEDFDSHSFDWSLFVDRIDASTPAASIQQVARYCYDTAVTIQKDFGTGTYVLSHSRRAAALEDHYHCTTEVREAWLLYPVSAIEEDIIEELDAGCPLMLHLRDKQDNYHAVAVDAYRFAGSTCQVHINMGWEGDDNGWYNFREPILQYDDNGYRKIITVRPPDPWPLPGDANIDGQVNAKDAAILAAHWLDADGVGWAEGDFNRDGVVDDLDASILAAHWVFAGGAANAVPEPSSLAILVAALASSATMRRRTCLAGPSGE